MNQGDKKLETIELNPTVICGTAGLIDDDVSEDCGKKEIFYKTVYSKDPEQTVVPCNNGSKHNPLVVAGGFSECLSQMDNRTTDNLSQGHESLVSQEGQRQRLPDPKEPSPKHDTITL